MDTYIKVTITRAYGEGNSVTIESGASKSVLHNEGIVEFDMLVEQINTYFDDFELKHLPHMRFSKAHTEDIRQLKAISVGVTLDKGKRYIKVFTPEFMEYGIQWWPEEMKEAGVNPRAIPDTGYKCKEGAIAWVLFKDNKPKKVIKVVAPN